MLQQKKKASAQADAVVLFDKLSKGEQLTLEEYNQLDKAQADIEDADANIKTT